LLFVDKACDDRLREVLEEERLQREREEKKIQHICEVWRRSDGIE